MMDEGDLRSRVARLSVEQKVRLLTGADFWALYPEPDIGLRRVVLSDGPAGVRGENWDERDTSANVPSPTALAATWDCERVEAIGRLLAQEARRKGVDVLLAPTVNLHRTPFGGRHFECFSEDPLLTARIGVAYVRGLQNSGVGATVKHFIGNDSETERMSVDVRIDERTLRELYLAPFEAMLRPTGGGEAGAWSVMAAYNGVNGATMTESPLLRDILHDEWGYDGLVMSDWTAARSTEPAARAALDLAMPGPASRFGPWGDALVAAVQAGLEERGGAVFRWMNGFGSAGAPEEVARLEISCAIKATEAGLYQFGVAGLGHFRLLVDGAEVLDDTLSMREGADVAETLMAPPQRLVPVDLAVGQTVAVRLEHDVHSSPMAGFGTFVQIDLEAPHGTDDQEIAAAVEAAAGSDVAVVVVGTTAEVESEGFDRTSLALPGRQDELVRRVAAANPRTVVVVNSGAPVLLPWADDVAAVLLTWFGGQEFGNALADVLLGDAEPGGRLPTTWPASQDGLPSTQPTDGVLTYTEGLFIGYRGYDRDGREPLFPFGHGQGYTTWSYDAITVDCAPVDLRNPADASGVAVCVELRNTGPRPGREIVQVYASRPDSAVERPAKWLAGFAAVDADPGETVNVGILIPERALAHWSDSGWTLEAGTFTLSAGSSSVSVPLTASVTLK
jgi:Glycosyl hydrolase family 3 C-terminal domain/Glycosyl hydrolase family 3 N terminal domain/Fibronectin type III-like domain